MYINSWSNIQYTTSVQKPIPSHICISKLAIIGSDNGLSPGQRQAIIWTNDGILLIGPLGTNFSEIFIAIETFSFKKKHLKMSSGKMSILSRPQWVKTVHVIFFITQQRLQGLKRNQYSASSLTPWRCGCNFKYVVFKHISVIRLAFLMQSSSDWCYITVRWEVNNGAYWLLSKDCSNSSAIAMELPESCAKPLIISICTLGSNWQQPSIGSGNGLVPYRKQAMTWTNVHQNA